MNDKTKKHLEDILIAIDEIESYFISIPKQYETFVSNIEIIGEAMNRILKTDKNVPISHARQIVDTRNYVIHGYDSLLPDMLWSIVINHLPLLKEEVKDILCQIDD